MELQIIYLPNKNEKIVKKKMKLHQRTRGAPMR